MNNLQHGIKLGLYASSQREKYLQEKNLVEPMSSFYSDGSNLTITFLSLNRSSLSLRLLNSIENFISEFKGEILIFDNGSEQDDLQILKEFIKSSKLSITLHEAKKNYGVSGGRNRSAKLIKTDWFLSLDNDIYLTDNPLPSIKNCVDFLGVEFLNMPLLNEDGQTVFTAGPNLYLEKYKDSFAIGTPTTFKQTLKSEIKLESPFLSTCLFGGISVLKTKSFINQGGYDENMFIGFEDLDFSIRLYKQGIKIGNIDKFCAVHGHEPPSNQNDLNYERTRFSKSILEESAKYFHSKHNIYAWNEGVDDWLADREKELELKNQNLDFTSIKDKSLKTNFIKRKAELPKIALVIDAENWAFHNHAKQIIRYLGESYNFQIFASANYENLGLLMLDIQDFDLIHFFWRADLFRLLDIWTSRFFDEKGWDYHKFITNIVANANITTSVYDHLFLSENEIQDRKILFNALSVGYTAVSEKLFNLYSGFEDYPPPLIKVGDAIDLELFKPSNLSRLSDSEREIIIGWSGNSNWGGDGIDHKGIETIIKPAVSILQSEGYKVRGFYADRQERWIPHNQMNDYYNSIDIYVCASDIEGTPNPALESMACGLPVISTDVGMVPELFGSLQKEFILEARSVDSLKKKLKKLIDNPQKRVALSNENLQRIQKWSWERISQIWDEFFQTILADVSNKHHKKTRDNLRKQALEAYLILRDLDIKSTETEGIITESEYLQILHLSNQLEHKINLMEQSKFWKIRGEWFKLKQKIGFSKDKY